MPSFAGQLSPTQIKDVAGFVATAAGTGQRRQDLVRPGRQEGRGLQRHGLLRTGLREPRVQRRAEGGPGQASAALRHESARPGRLPSNRPQDRSGRAPPLQGRRWPGICRRQRHLRLRLLPRAPAMEARGGQGRPGRGVASTACNDPQIKANAFNYYQCNHGLGHGLMLYTSRPSAALDYCHQLLTEVTRSRAAGASSWRTRTPRSACTRSG